MRKPHWPHVYASAFWPLSLPSFLIPALASVWGDCGSSSQLGGFAGIQTLLRHWGDGGADGKAGASAACLPGLEPSGPPAPATHLFVFLGLVCVHTQGIWHARLHLISSAFLPVASPSRSLTMCLLFFPAHRSHALFLSCFSTRTHVHTHTHTHTQQTNRALTLSKLEDHEAVVAACTDALKLDPVNEKALFRRGVARSRLGFFDEAEADLNQVATNPEL